MSAATSDIFLDLPVLLDYCRVDLPECDMTRTMVNRFDGGSVNMSDRVYEFWHNSVMNILELMKYLKIRQMNMMKPGILITQTRNLLITF